MSDIDDILAADYDQEALWMLLQPASGRAIAHKRPRTLKVRWHKRVDDAFTSDESKYATPDSLYHALHTRYEDVLRERLDRAVIESHHELVAGYQLPGPPGAVAGWPSNYGPRYELEEESNDAFAIPEEDREPTVRLSRILTVGAIVMAVICLLSLVIWAFKGITVIGPFAAILILAVTPIFYVMGRLVEKGHRE